MTTTISIALHVTSGSIWIVDQEVRDGVTWYKYHLGEGYDYWLPEHNGADWEQVYKKYVEEPYNDTRNSMSEEDKMNEWLFTVEQVWNKTYYNVTVGKGVITVGKMYAYKNSDGTITSSNTSWVNCDVSVFDDTSLLEYGTVIDNLNGGNSWLFDGNTLFTEDYTKFIELASELYYHLIDIYGEDYVYWNQDSSSLHMNGESLQGEHDWDVYGDGSGNCKNREEHIAKCQGN